MRCCAPFCRNAPENVMALQAGRQISFHGFPSDMRLRAAWLRALGKQDIPLPDPAVVCSQHFMDDDIYETESGSRQINAGAVPSTVQVCMMCLETDSKLFLLSKYKLEKAYGYLTGYAPCNQGNLKQTICVQCAQRLMNFSRFRDQSLRARALMIDLVEKHELITRRHIKMINRTKYRLKSPMVVTTLGADFCDLHIQEDTSDDKQTESETTIDTGVVKTEESDDSIAIGEDMNVIYEEDVNANEINKDDTDSVNNEIKEKDDNTDNINNDFVALHDENISDDSIMLDTKLIDHALLKALQKKPDISDDSIMLDTKLIDNALLKALQKKPAIVNQVAKIQDLLKSESADIKCPLCSKEFVQDLLYMEHMRMHAQSGSAAGESGTTGVCERRAACGDGPSLTSLTEIKPNTADEYHRPDTVGRLPRPNTTGALHRPNTAGLHDDRARADVTHTSVVTFPARVAISNDSEDHLTEKADAGPSSEKAITTVSGDDYQSSDSNSRRNDNIGRYTNCIVKLLDVFGKKVVPKRDASLTKRRKLVFCCDSCFDFKNKSSEIKSQNEVHTRKYIEPATDEEQVNVPKNLESKSDCLNNDIMKQYIYTPDSSSYIPEKIYFCDFCRAMFQVKSLLVKHIQSHMTVNRFTCEVCQYKCKYNFCLTRHMRKHTGKKSFSCKLCEYKSARKGDLVIHMRKHTGGKPFSCMLCEYKSTKKSNLAVHMRRHTGEKPFSCKLCEYKSAKKSNLTVHMRKHTGEKPFSCKLCEYKSAQESYLTVHMRKHTGEKPFSCNLCVYKSAHKRDLVVHMRKHTNEKPFSCKLCEYKSVNKSHLAVHMRKHTSEKPLSCKLCEYKSPHKGDLVIHMRKHTGKKPFSCKLCEYKSTNKSSLVVHMMKHTGEKPFACMSCEYKTAHKRYLTVHMRKHTGEKPFSCNLCEYKSAHKNGLAVHMRGHTGAMPCKLCEYKSANESNLAVHMRKHTGEKPFSCKLCEHKTAIKGDLKVHMKIHR